MNPPAKTAELHSIREMISFEVFNQTFCLDVMSVREIRSWTVATPLPHAPQYVCGVINLRGAILPIVDLASRLGYPRSTDVLRSAIIVAEVGEQVFGLLVDGVNGIETVDDADLKPAPSLGDDLALFVRGIRPLGGKLVTDLRLDGLLTSKARQARVA